MEYVAILTREGRQWLAEFPDAPGCQTFANSEATLAVAAQEALEGWLEAHLVDGQVPAAPKGRVKSKKLLHVQVPTALALAIELRRARIKSGLTQADAAKRAGVSQQQIAKLERPGENPTIGTVVKVAAAVGARVEVSVRAGSGSLR